MTTVRTPERTVPTGTTTPPAPVATSRAATANRWIGAALRLSIGSVFLWAFFDKLLGLGHETPSENAWIDGGSPTEGFLSFAVKGPFADAYKSIAGDPWADWMFMIGLLGIGVALTAGIAMRIAAASGALLLFLMWTAVLPPENHVFMDDHIVYALVLVSLALTGAGHTLGLGRTWDRLPLVRRFPVLK